MTKSAATAVDRNVFARTARLIGEDIRHRCQYEFKPATWRSGLRMLRHPGVACVVVYRLQCLFFALGLTPIGWLFKFWNQLIFRVSFDHRASIAGGLLVSHADAMLVAANVTIGERCVLMHQNTIAPTQFRTSTGNAARIVVGNDVTFAGGAGAFGPITIGDDCRIGVNAVVQQSCPAGSSLFGVPAAFVGRRPTS